MTADDEKFLPREPFDLPLPEKEISAHADSGQASLPETGTVGQTRMTQETTNQVRTLLTWKSPGRPFKKRGKEFYLNMLLIVTCLAVIAALFHQYILILLILSLSFVVFALSITPPHDFHYRISTEGITIEDHFYLWQELYDFYFKKRNGIDVLHIRTEAFIPGELTLTLGDVDKEHIKSVLLPYLPYREVIKPTFMEKSADFLSRNFPLERTEKAHS